MRKIFQANVSKKQDGTAIFISDKEDYIPQLIRRDIEGYYILIKGKLYQEEISILNIYSSTSRTSRFVGKTHLQVELHIDSHKLIVGDFNNELLSINRSSIQN